VETKVQEFLRGGGTYEDLRNRYAIGMRRHSERENLVLLKYNQIESPFAEQIVQECRGIILDESRNWEVVSRGFDKFFNHGEGHAAPIDWNTASVQEKVDGSLCVLYHYDDQWHVATTGTPDASGDVSGFGVTFKDYFWSTAKECGMQSPSSEHVDWCFMMELTGPINRIVVRHERPSLTVLGMRNRRTGQERSAHEASCGLKIPSVRSFALQSVDDIVASFAEMSPLSQEGYVVHDGAFRRIKVKHPGYVALHHAKDGLSQKAFVEIVRSGESSEVLTSFPEFAPMFDDVRTRWEALVAELQSDYERIRSIPEQKTFAAEAVKTRCSAALFAIRAKKTPTIRQWLRDVHIDSAMKLLGYKE
jgi:hypothetical protein